MLLYLMLLPAIFWKRAGLRLVPLLALSTGVHVYRSLLLSRTFFWPRIQSMFYPTHQQLLPLPFSPTPLGFDPNLAAPMYAAGVGFVKELLAAASLLHPSRDSSCNCAIMDSRSCTRRIVSLLCISFHFYTASGCSTICM